MKLKQIPEDFKVYEIPDYSTGSGNYKICKLTKKNYTTEKAVSLIAKSLHLARKQIGYAGIKDKQAVTEQFISIEYASQDKIEKLSLKDIELDYICDSNKPLSIGDLKGNKFEIVVREINELPEKKIVFKNYFDEQRFSNNNVEIGKAILQGNYKLAVEEILKNDGYYEEDVKAHLLNKENDYVGALKKIPFKILLLFIHAYQSNIFNILIESMDDGKAPLVGFGTEFEDEEIENKVDALLDKDGLTTRSFIINSIPGLSSEGNYRDVNMKVNNLEISDLEDDELNNGFKKCTISFSLGKGSYATTVIKGLFGV